MTDTIAIPLWALGGAVLALLVFAAIAIARVGSRQTFGFFAQVAASLLLVGVAWIYLDRLDAQDRTEQHRAFEARLSALTAQSLAPNSNLACLNDGAGDAVQEACEKALYAGPGQVSAALAFVGARIDLLRDLAALHDADDAVYARMRAPLVQSLQADRFGFVAQVLQARDGCSADSCDAFDLVGQRDQLVANMRDRAFDVRVVRYSAGWDDKPSAPALAAHTSQTPPHAPTNANFPSAASIPPVSIMNNEPGMPGQNGVDPPARQAAVPAKPEAKPDAKPEGKAEAKSEPRPATPPSPPRRPAQKAQQSSRQSAQSAAPAQASPFPQPVAPPAQQTTGAPAQITPQ